MDIGNIRDTRGERYVIAHLESELAVMVCQVLAGTEIDYLVLSKELKRLKEHGLGFGMTKPVYGRHFNVGDKIPYALIEKLGWKNFNE